MNNAPNNEKPRSKKIWLYNAIFLMLAAGLLFFLFNAPEETTKKLPDDEIHQRFMVMDKKAAEKFCESCHNPQGEAPLPLDHPPKYRCLFCHKKQVKE
jgi:hypothetical protein